MEEQPDARPDQQPTPSQTPPPSSTPGISQYHFDPVGIEEKKKSHWLLYLIGVLIIIGALGYMIYDFMNLGHSSLFSKVTPTPTPSMAPTVAPTATPPPANLDKSKLDIKVLNGSGTAGAASKMKDTLEKLGYTVTSTGNADNYNYAQTEIHVSSDQKQYLDTLKKDLSSDYTISTADTNYSGTGAEVIVGKQ